MIYLGIILLFLYSAFRGINEGIVFYLVNPRYHPWFGWYHVSRTAEVLCLILATICLWTVRGQVYNYWLIFGASLLCWEAFELCYSSARLGQVDDHENFLGVLTINSSMAVLSLHGARLLLGTGLLLTWRYL